MKLLYMPVFKAFGVLLLVAIVSWLANYLFDLPLWLVIIISVLSALLTGFADVQKNMTLKTYFRAIQAWFNDALYLYELDIRINAKSDIKISSLAELIEGKYSSKAKIGIKGGNYIQLRLLEPPKTIEIKIQPNASSLMDECDDEEKYTETRVVSIDFVDPIELHYRKSSDQSVRDMFDALRDLAYDVERAIDGEPPYFTVTINRASKGSPLKHPEGPGPTGTVQDTPSVRIRRDNRALQLQSKSSSSIVKHLTENIADLEPVV